MRSVFLLKYRPFRKVRETMCQSQNGAACCIGVSVANFLKRSIVQGEPKKNGTSKTFGALKMSNICQQNVSKQL